MNDMLQIKDVSEKLGVSKATLRRWEAKGLIQAKRSPTGYRLYDKKEIERILRSVK